MRALECEVVDAAWAAVEPLLPPPRSHPLGCHRPRVPDRLWFWGILIRLTTGSSWVDIEAILGHQVSDTTLRARRDEWIAADVFEQLKAEATAAFDRIIGLDMSDVALDGSLHKAPYGGEGTGPNPADRGKRGWSGLLLLNVTGSRSGWTIDGANRHDIRLLEPTIEAVPLAMTAGCVDIAQLTDLGEAGAGITFVGPVNVSDPSTLSGQLRSEATTYQAKMAEYAEGGSDTANKGFASQGFATVMTLWEIANEQVAGDPAAADPAAFSAIMAATDGHHAYLSPGISCADGAAAAPYVSVCSTDVTATQWDGESLVVVDPLFSGFHLIQGTELELGT